MDKIFARLRYGRGIARTALLSLLALSISACGAPTEVPRPQEVATPIAQAPNTPAPNPPAIVEPVPTTAAEAPVAPVAPDTSADNGNGADLAAQGGDVSTWSLVNKTTDGVTYSYRYPPGWTTGLTYCAPGAARTASGSQLPPRCAATDILVGQKARDLGTFKGENITLGGKQAIKEIDRSPRNGQAEVIYTVMIYDATGLPLMGFSTNIGPGTDAATVTNMLTALNQVAGTLVVGR
ncbi:MAG: hypothetical protein ABI670_03340 [Chloroflexota bacterium]